MNTRMLSQAPARAIAALVAATFVSLPVLAQDDDFEDVELVPHPELEELKPDVRDRLTPAVDHFRKLRSQADGRELGIAYGRMGVNYLAHEQQEAAGACFRNAIALDPTNARWPYFLAVHYEETGELGKAVDMYSRSIAGQPAYVAGYLRLGKVLLELERLDEAKQAFQIVAERDLDNAPALAGLGDVASRRGEHQKAIDYYRRALAADPEATQLHYRLGQAYRAAGDADAARAELAKRGQRIPAIEDPLLAFLQAHTRGAEHFVKSARTAAQVGKPGVAMRFYELAVSMEPENAQALLELGRLQAADGQFGNAMRTFQEARKVDPDNAELEYFIGTLYEQGGEELEAERYYRRALELRPELVEPRTLLANSLMRRGEYEEAGEHYAQVAHQLPQNTEILYLLGMAWTAADKCEWAHPVLHRGLELAPGDGQMMVALARVYSTCESADADQREQALDAAQRMYARDPDIAAAETLAMACAANGFWEDAVDFQAQAIFESLKEADESRTERLQAELERYRQNLPATEAWPADAEVFAPARLGRGPAPARTADTGGS